MRRHQPNNTDVSDALIEAIRKGNGERVKSLLERGASPNAREKLAVPSLGVLEWLGIARIDRQTWQENAKTALILAVEGGRVDIVTALIHAGADLDFITGNHYCALGTAVIHGRADMVNLLLDRGADINLTNQDGATPLIIAVGHDHDEIVSLLLNRGANPNVIDVDGGTALIYAAGGGRYQQVVSLLSAGADVSVRDNEGRTAYGWAKQSHHEQIAQLLKQNGSNE